MFLPPPPSDNPGSTIALDFYCKAKASCSLDIKNIKLEWPSPADLYGSVTWPNPCPQCPPLLHRLIQQPNPRSMPSLPALWVGIATPDPKPPEPHSPSRITARQFDFFSTVVFRITKKYNLININ